MVTIYKLHNSMNKHGMQAFTNQLTHEKGPIDSIIHFFEVQIRDHHTQILSLRLMDNFLERENSIGDKPTLD